MFPGCPEGARETAINVIVYGGEAFMAMTIIGTLVSFTAKFLVIVPMLQISVIAKPVRTLAVAIRIPRLSYSGVTIVSSPFMGLKREKAQSISRPFSRP